MLEKIILESFVTVIAILFSFISLVHGKGLDRKTKLIFVLAMTLFSILVVTDSADYYFSNSTSKLNPLRYVTTIISYSLKPCIPLFIVLTLLRHDNRTKIMIGLLLPLVINFVFCVISPFTHIVFSFTETNHFVRGYLGYMPSMISGIYLALLLYLVIKKRRLVDVGEILLIAFIIIVAIIAMIIETVFYTKFIINGTGVLCVIFYYIYLHTETFQRDTLTGLFNRNSFYGEIEGLSSKTYIVCLDINNFKSINDNFGHLAGDDVLKSIATTIKNNLTAKSKAYRVGGDEFVIIMYEEESTVEKSMSSIVKDVYEKGYSIAYGYECFNSGDDFEAAYNKADGKMYICKKNMKGSL